MSPTAAFMAGVRRVNGAPLVLGGMFAVTLLLALPLSLALRGMIAEHLGPSLAGEQAATGVNYDWWQEFAAQAQGLGTTFVPSIIGFGAVLDNLSGLLDNRELAATIAGVTVAWLVVWSFLSGGVLDRYARGRPTRPHGFFAACGVHFWRFARLGLLAWLVYAALFVYVHHWILVSGFERLTRDVTAERTAFAIRVACYGAFGGLLVLSSIVFDYARVRIVVEDRQSAIGALVAAVRFTWRHAWAVCSLYALVALAFLALVLTYSVTAPGAGFSGWWVLALGEAYILGRHYVKLLFYASETALFQGALAHASYTAGPTMVWPDSPAAESIANADPQVIADPGRHR